MCRHNVHNISSLLYYSATNKSFNVRRSGHSQCGSQISYVCFIRNVSVSSTNPKTKLYLFSTNAQKIRHIGSSFTRKKNLYTVGNT